MMKKGIAIFAMTTLGLQSVQAGFFDQDFTGVTDIDGLTGTEFEASKTRVNDASALNNILKSLKYLRENAANGKFVDGTTATDAVFTGGNVGIGTSTPESEFHINTNGGKVLVHTEGSGRPTVQAYGSSNSNAVAMMNLSSTSTSETITAKRTLERRNYHASTADDRVRTSYINGNLETTGATVEEVSGSLSFGVKNVGQIVPIEAMLISSNGNVGIGTDAPTEKLEVNGDILQGPNTWGEKLRVGIDAALATVPEATIGATNGNVHIESKDGHHVYINHYTDGGNLFIGSGNSNTNGKVKIGGDNTAPTEKLDVVGNVKATAFIGDGSQLTNLPSNGKFVDGTTATDAVFTGGNVGIGTTTPTEKLEVKSETQAWVKLDAPAEQFKGIRLTSNNLRRWDIASHNTAETGSNAGSELLINRFDDNGDFLDIVMAFSRENGNVGIGTTAPTEKLDVAGNVKATAFIGDGSQLTNLPSGGKFVDGTTATDAVFTGGNVGIGELNPGHKLVVAGTAQVKASAGTDARIEFHRSDTGANSWIGIPDWNDDALFIYGPTATGNESIAKYEAGAWSLNSAGLTRMTIDSTGNVGIGTETPSDKLHVNGNVRSDGSIILTGATTITKESTKAIFAGNSGVGIKANGPTGDEHLTVSQSGNVGIGTNPQRPLHIASADTATVIIEDTNAGPDLKKRFINVVNSGAMNFGSFVDDMSSSTKHMVIDAEGDVGIGTTGESSPARLAVRQDVDESSGGFALYDATGVSSFGIWREGANAGSTVHFRDRDLGTVMALRDGNVGIGTDLPTEKLDIAGAVKIADTASACDETKEGTIRFVTDAQADGTNVRDFQGCMGVDIDADNTPDIYEWKSLTGIVQ